MTECLCACVRACVTSFKVTATENTRAGKSSNSRLHPVSCQTACMSVLSYSRYLSCLDVVARKKLRWRGLHCLSRHSRLQKNKNQTKSSDKQRLINMRPYTFSATTAWYPGKCMFRDGFESIWGLQARYSSFNLRTIWNSTNIATLAVMKTMTRHTTMVTMAGLCRNLMTLNTWEKCSVTLAMTKSTREE